MVTYHFIVFFETVLGREHSGKVSKRLFGTFNFGGKTLSGHLPFLGSTTKNIAFVTLFSGGGEGKRGCGKFWCLSRQQVYLCFKYRARARKTLKCKQLCLSLVNWVCKLVSFVTLLICVHHFMRKEMLITADSGLKSLVMYSTQEIQVIFSCSV